MAAGGRGPPAPGRPGRDGRRRACRGVGRRRRRKSGGGAAAAGGRAGPQGLGHRHGLLSSSSFLWIDSRISSRHRLALKKRGQESKLGLICLISGGSIFFSKFWVGRCPPCPPAASATASRHPNLAILAKKESILLYPPHLSKWSKKEISNASHSYV